MVTINLQALRNANGWTDKKAFEEAMKDTSPGLEIYFPAGGGTGPGGAYDIWTDTWAVPGSVPADGNLTRGDVTLYGDGYSTVIRQPDAGQLVFMAHPPQNDPSLIRSNILIRDMLLDGCLGRNSGGYNEFSHLIQLAGVDKFTALRVLFRNAMGDGLFLGSPNSTIIRKISNLLLERCRFEATSSTDKGRNAISFHECEGYTITYCSFENIGSNRSGVGPGPGAIDIEPKNSAARITNGNINNCSFVNVNRCAIALLNGVQAVTTDVEVSYCNLYGAGWGFFDIQGHSAVYIHDNYCESMGLDPGYNYMGYIRNSTNLNILTNTFIGGRFIILENVSHININGNGFRDCGRSAGALFIQDGDVTWGSINNNNLYNCGQPGGVNAIYYLRAPDKQLVFMNIKWNTVNAPSDISQVGIVDRSYLKLEDNPSYNVDPNDNYPSGLSLGNMIKKP